MVSIHLTEKIPGLRLLGSRQSAMPVRDELESALHSGQDVAIDFSGVEATQSFVDELVGVLVYHEGPDVANRLIFRGCSRNVRAIIEFVLTDRAEQFAARHMAH